MIDALGLILGARASTEIVRKGAKKSIIEGIFQVEGNKLIESLLEKNNIEKDSELIVRREISLRGTNRCFINDTPVSLNVIKDFGNLLVDLHGQHEHQSLLRVDTHIPLLDEYGNLSQFVCEFQKQIMLIQKLTNEIKELENRERVLKEKKDLYEFQLKEIDTVSPKANEDEELEAELNILENSEKLLESTSSIFQSIYEDENSIYDTLVRIKNEISSLGIYDNKFIEKEGEFESALTIIADVAEFLRKYKDDIDLNPQRLEENRQRLNSIKLLIKKYGGSLKNVIDLRTKITKEVELVENFENKIDELNKELNRLRIKAGNEAENISEKRKEISLKIKKEIENELNFLGISNSIFEINISQKISDNSKLDYIIFDRNKYQYNSSGFDEVEFYISTNIGENPKPLTKVASGGEISRIMLAIKSILAKNIKLPLLIFDEIDTGISGRIAQKVGHAIKVLAEHHQIIAITHLPQIAGMADHHYSVEKVLNNERMISKIRVLNEDERIEEIAKILSGENITEASLKSAKELIDK